MKIWSRIGVRQNRWGPPDSSFSATTAQRPMPTQPASLQPASGRKQGLEIGPLFESGHSTSNRFCPKNRSYRKQNIKLRLTGARTAITDFRISAVLHVPACAKLPELTRSSVLYRRGGFNNSTNPARSKSTSKI